MGKLINFYNEKKYSMRVTLISYYIIIFVIFILGFEIFTYFSLREYYYDNIKTNMKYQSEYSVELYESSISEYSISDVVLNKRFEFISNIDGQVQILDNIGVLYYDNTGSDLVGKTVEKIDNLSKINFKFDFNSKNLILNYPIKINSKQIGVLRTITSLEQINKEISLRMNFFITFGFFTAIVALALIIYFSNKFLSPINKLITFANKLSDGQYKEKSNISYKGEIGELAYVLDEMSENIVKKEEIKTDFISSVSHELRTPLTSIKGWAITLQDSDIDKETLSTGLQIIEQESDRLSDMVEDLLDFSRFTSPRFVLSKSRFNIIDVVRNITKQMKIRTDEKNIDLIFEHDKESIIIVADNNRLKQIFINLIDNAIKFTPDGGSIIVNVKDKEDKIICEVIDTGIGISEEEIGLVTTKFYKGSTSASHTGLGLSICEEIIIQHNGELNIISKESVGTTIHFEIPKGVTNEEN